MAKAKIAKAEDDTGTSEIPLAQAKVKCLIIKNFRCIGPEPVGIDLDDIVVLVGPNNAGKSTILRAYELVMSQGSAEGRLKSEDFPNEVVDPDNLPEIELQTFIFDDFPAKKWVHVDEETGQNFVRERWRWDSPNKDPKRQGHRVAENDWDDSVPWGAPNVANARRPLPHRVDAFSSPEEQGEKLVDLLRDILLAKARNTAGDEASVVEQLTTKIKELQKRIVDESKGDIEGIEKTLSEYIGEIFVGFRVTLDTKTDQVPEKAFNFFSTKPILRMGPQDGHMAPLDKQGSGARRTLLWSALKIASEKQPETGKKSAKAKAEKKEEVVEKDVPLTRPHVLLLDEPEICLHPSAIRDACRVLYDLADKATGWQVMVTTHSPAFVDLSRDNTTIVRVERVATGKIVGTTVFRPNRVKLTDDDKEALKLLNLWDPYVAEFFFGGRTVIVEGDTEYSVFREIMEGDRAQYRNAHIVRARGKFVLPPLMKILNHFGNGYALLHDSDKPKLANGKANGAWAANERIASLAKVALVPERVRVAASVPNFEVAFFGEEGGSDKPYNAVKRVRADAGLRERLKAALDYLLFKKDVPPQELKAWTDIGELEAAVAALPE